MSTSSSMNRCVTQSLDELLDEVRACTVCVDHLDHGVRPIVQMSSTARIVIIGQAPGRRVHESGIPWDDQSGRTLRKWLGVSDDVFYDPATVAIMPMGFCYPGSASSGDKPPRPECAPLWHERLLEQLPGDRLTVLIGMYAQKQYVKERRANLTNTVAAWKSFLPDRLVLPHPSPRNQHWLTKYPWFERDVLPAAQRRIQELLAR